MVTDRQQPSGDGPDPDRSVVTVERESGMGRAQLLLVGAIVLAVVIVGLSVVANSFFTTGSGASVDVSTQSDTATQFDYESRRGLRSVVLQLNHRNRNLTAPGLATAVDDNVTGYSRLLSESYVRSDGATVNLTYHNESSAFGRRVVQSDDGRVTDNSSDPDWAPVPDHREIGRFVMNVDVASTDTQPPMVIEVRNTTGESVIIELSRTTTGGGEALQVRSDVSYAGTTEAVCDGVNDRVLLDLETGDSISDDCEFPGADALTGPVTVEIGSGSTVVGKYGIVVQEPVSSSHYESCLDGPTPVPADEPCSAPVVRTANVTARFAGNEVQYVNRLNVSVYEGPLR